MPSTMFGTPEGTSRAEHDNYVNTLAQESAGRVQQQPAIRQQHEAQARFLNSRANLADRQAQVQERMAQELKRMSTDQDTGEEFSNPAYRIANAAANAGDYALSYKAANIGSQIDYRQAGAATQAAREKLIKARTALANMDKASRALGNVTDQPSFEEAISNYERETGTKTGMLDEEGHFKGQFSMAAVDKLRKGTLSTKDQILTQMRKQENESRERERLSKQSARTFWQSFENIKKRETVKAEARKTKTTGDPLVPLERVTKAGADYIVAQYPDDMEPAEARVKGAKLMEIAESFKKQNPALGITEAKQRAFEKMQKDGEFAGHKQKAKASGPNNPQQLPASGQKADLKEGQYYTDGNGVRQWKDGKWGDPITKAGSDKPSDSVAEADETGDEDDEEADQLALADDED